MARIKCGVLGTGRLGYWHAINASTRLQNAEVVTICDIDRKRAEEVAKELNIPNFTDNPDEVFYNDEIDAVIICTPTTTHYELLKKASENGKKIFVEKPITIDLNEAYEVRDTFRKNGTICQVGFMRRFDPAYDQAKQRIDAGDIGEPIYFKGISRDPIAPHTEFIKSSGGIFVDVSIHDFDIARYLMGSEVIRIASNGSVLKNPSFAEFNDVDQGISYVEFASGAIGDIEASRNAYYGYDIRAEIIGTEGSLFIGDLRHHNLSILNKSGKTHDIVPNFPERFEDAYFLELKHFFHAIEEGFTPRVVAEDGVKALEIAVAARESLESNRVVAV